MARNPKSIKVGWLVVGGIVLIWAIAVFVIVMLTTGLLRAYALEEAESKAQLILNRHLATHTYFTHDLKPSLFALIDEADMPADYFEPSWMSSTYAVREMDTYFQNLADEDYYYKEAAVNARTPVNEADAFERGFIEGLNEDPELMSESLVREFDGVPYFVTIRRGEQMDESCIRCHDTPDRAPGDLVDYYGPERSFDREAGDVVSAISIRVPLAGAYASVRDFSLRLLTALLVLLGSLLLVQMIFYQRFVLKPLYAMRDTALLIATDEDHVGDHVPVPFGREFAELAAAFNSMSDALQAERTKLMARNEELARLNRMKDDFIVNVSHELRTPLTNLNLYQYLLGKSPDRMERYLPVLERETGRLGQIIESILDLSHMNLDQFNLQPGPVDLNELVRSYANDRSVRAELKSLTLTLREQENLPIIQADRFMLGRVIDILVTNALNYTPEGGRIEIWTRSRDAGTGQWAGFSVKDTGPGIPPDEQDRVFERFFRGRISLDTATPGSGLGLAIAKAITEAHGGQIEIESEGMPGKGSTFTVWLPVFTGAES